MDLPSIGTMFTQVAQMAGFRRPLTEELRALRHRTGFAGAGRWRAVLIHSAVLGLFGVVLPYLKGIEFLDAVILGAYACLGLVFAAPSAAAPLESAPPARALARVAVCVAYGSAMSWILLACGLAVVYFSSPFMIGLDLRALGESVLFGAMLCAAAASLAAFLALRVSAAAARAAMRAVFLGLLLAFLWNARRLPEISLPGAGIAGAVALWFLTLLAIPRSTPGAEA
jgi:hypothetical protein